MVIQYFYKASLLCSLGSVALCGCSNHTAEPARPVERTVVMDTHSASQQVAHLEKADPEVVQATGILTLKDVFSLVLTNNKELSAFSWDVRAAEARILQSGVFPNPSLSFELEDAFGNGEFSGTKQAQTTLQISELVELGGKRKAREGVALRARDISYLEFEKTRLRVLSDASDAFYQVAAHQEELRLVDRAATLARSNQKAIHRKVEAGKSSIVDEKRANIALAKTTIAAEHVEHELASARKELASLWGGIDAQFTELKSDLFLLPTLPPYEVLEAKLDSNPEIHFWLRDENLRRAESLLASSNAVPDINLGAGIRRFEGTSDEALLFRVSVPLPLFDRNEGAIAEARARTQKSGQQVQSLRVRHQAALFGLYQELRHKKLEFDILTKEILPEAESALGFAREGFEQGRFSHLELADAQKTFLESREAQIQAAVAYRHLMVELGRLTGETVND